MHERRSAWLWLLCALPLDTAVAIFDPVFDDGFDCRLWFLDADGDGFGAPGTGELTCAPQPLRVVRADDCNDGNAAINPLAPDSPDPLYTDANCDGSDGDADRAIHVALTGINGAGCGTRMAPCRTIDFALSLRSSARPELYIQQGAYQGAVVVPNFAAAGIFGGFLADWTRAPGASTEINGGASAMLSQNSLGLAVSGGVLVLGDLRIVAPPAAGAHADGTGRGAFALVVRDTTLTAFGLRLEAGAGAVGAAGSGGGSVPPAAPVGGIGGNGSSGIVCSISPGGTSGPGSTNSCVVAGRPTLGGAGGRGGASDTDCSFPFDFSARPGIVGGDAAFVSGTSGEGGSGGSGGTSCSTPVAGTAGAAGPAGAPGTAGAGGAIVSVSSPLRWWRAGAGFAGSLGDHGGGGGGGGGSGGCDSGGNATGAGGGGGGAGGCRAPVSGAGGAGGGASVALFADNAVVTLTQSTLQASAGGRGGNGGAGTLGQPGGQGGEGGTAETMFGNARDGADGGAGGRGGASGGGGGGAGGASIGILRLAGSLTQTGNTIQPGSGGSGGSGGAAAGTPTGAAGANGVQQSVRACTSVSDC